MKNYKKESILLDRIKVFEDGFPYRGSELTTLKSVFYSDYHGPDTLEVTEEATGNIPFSEAITKPFRPCKIGEEFGPSWAIYWFHFTITLPSDLRKSDSEIHLRFDSSSEALLFNKKGEALQGFTGQQGNNYRYFYSARRKSRDRNDFFLGKTEYYMQMSCCNLFGNGYNGNIMQGTDENRYFKFKICDIAVFNREAWELWHKFKIIGDCAKHLEGRQGSRKSQALMTAGRIIHKCDINDSSTWGECVKIADQFLAIVNPLSQHQIYAIGHCHIDLAWLWPIDETRRKGARSWSSQIELMLQYSDFNFTASQAQLFEWVQNDYPQLFAKMLKMKDRFIPVGGTWVEFDGNVPSGESMVRQFLYGQRYFHSHYGEYSKVFFLPDTFGYSAQLPQITRLAGIKNFVTQKLSWNYFNKFPHSTFLWKGIDSSEVLTHFCPADTYCGIGNVNELLRSQTNFKDKGRTNSSLYLFGVGDGGGIIVQINKSFRWSTSNYD